MIKNVTDGIFKRIYKDFLRAVDEYALVENGDHIAVCISGGKDSVLLALCMREYQRESGGFSLEFLSMDPGYNTANRRLIESNCKLLDLPVKIFETEIFEAVTVCGGSPCYLCARMRRGYLYKNAMDLNCNKIALGHHFDDVIETVLMGMIYNGQIQSMLPKLNSKNFEGMQLIRPLYRVKERDIIAWRDENNLTFLQCACRFTEDAENSVDKTGDSKRAQVKKLIADLRADNSKTDENIFNSMYNINLNEINGYKKGGTPYKKI